MLESDVGVSQLKQCIITASTAATPTLASAAANSSAAPASPSLRTVSLAVGEGRKISDRDSGASGRRSRSWSRGNPSDAAPVEVAGRPALPRSRRRARSSMNLVLSRSCYWWFASSPSQPSKTGKDIAVASKEILVMAGEAVMSAAQRKA